jgi:hypothetical protein
MSSATASWQLEGSNGYFTCGPMHGRIALKHLVSGVSEKTWQGLQCDDFAVLQLVAPLVEAMPPRELTDSYVRGPDLVATYARTAPLTVAPQICWRVSFAEVLSAVQIEVVLSMHTDLLDSQPYSAVNSVGFECRLFHAAQLDATNFQQLTQADGADRFEARDSATHLFLFRSDQVALSYAEMVHPDDFVEAEIDYRGEHYGSYRFHSLLFPERLEKGVIRRGRICGWFMPAEDDLETAVRLAQQFIEEPLPLTA